MVCLLPLGFPFTSFFRITSELIQEHNYTHGHLEIMSELLYAQAELSYAQDKPEKSRIYYKKAEILLRHLLADSNTFDIEKQERLNYLKTRVQELAPKG